MTNRNAHLIAPMDAVTTGRSEQFDHVVQGAYAAGLGRDDLLGAVEISRFLVDVPALVLAQAYATVSVWPVTVVRRFLRQPALVPRAA